MRKRAQGTGFSKKTTSASEQAFTRDAGVGADSNTIKLPSQLPHLNFSFHTIFLLNLLSALVQTV